MWKKIFSLLIFGLTSFYFGQNKYSIEQVEKSSDVKIIASFIKDNPTHPKVPLLKRKIATLITENGSTHTSSTNTASKINVSKKTTISDNRYPDKHRTAELLTHIFNNDPNKKEIYLSIFNESKCDLEVLIKGKSTHKLKVPSMKSNFVLIDKGSYTLSSTVCGAAYHATKSLYKDLEIKLKN